MKTRLFFLIGYCIFAWNTQAQSNDEKLLVNENFQSWDALNSSATETFITKKTDFSYETLVYKLREVQVAPATINTDRFSYPPASAGYLMANKSATPYIELSPLASITKVEFIHGATGSNRGYQLWKKSATDTDWVSVSNAVANPASGSIVSVTISETNVALKWTNLNAEQNAYLFDLKIYGNYTSAAPQVHLNTSINIQEAGTITRSINSDTYDSGTTVNLTATANFGYRFVKWTNAASETLANTSSFDITLNTDKTVIAVFEAVTTYHFSLSIEGSRWGEVKLTPEPVNGQYEAETVVTATIVSNPVTTFSFWENGSSETVRTIQVNENKEIMATFDEIPFIVGWDFAVQEPRSGRGGDYYSESNNAGTISLYKPDGTTINWLANTGSFNPSYPCARKWTTGADFNKEQRYYQASFSTEGYINISLTSLMSGNYQVHSKQILQYSLNGTQFTDLTTVDISDVYNSGWVPCNTVLPQEAENKSKIYVRWVADITSSTLGNASDNDGTALTNVFIYADKATAIDNDPPQLISTSPAESSASASASGSIVLTFNERVQIGSGAITLNGETLTGIFGSKTATFKYAGLSYNTEYVLAVPAGALQDLSGNAFAGLTLTFKTMNRPQPIVRTVDFVVAKDGSGNGTTIQSAFNAAPANGTPFLIFVKNGLYEERPSLSANKPNVSLIGQNRDGVVISAAVYSGLNGASTSTCQTLEILADHFYMENITIQNTAGADAGQAVALKDYGKYNAYKNVKLLGHQDTHLTGNSSIQYYQRCDIRGTVDFIFGGGDIFFDECLLYCIGRSNGDVLTAPSTLAATQWGYVFRDCTIDGDAATQNNKYQLGRPWQNAPRSIFINTLMKILPTASGWTNMGVIPALFAEYNSINANSEPVDLTNRKSEYTASADNGGQTVGGLQTVLTDAQAAQYTSQNVVKGSIDWNPLSLTEATDAPVLTGSDNGMVWEKVDYAICYIILQNGNVVNITTNNFYPVVRDNSYTVYAVAESGALSALSNSFTQMSSLTPAFPGAEGHGRYTTGGRGGNVVRVTTLADNASGQAIINGSLRWAFQQASPKTIVFDVSGTIELKQQLKTGKDNITIAGQTAPGNGICISGYDFAINSNNIIIRYVRFRPGDESGGEPDGLGGMDKKNIIIDHCSVSWSVDECLSVYGMENLTVQWCVASEALRVSIHGKGTHGYGGNWGGNKASYHHNLIAHCESRTPRLGPRPATQLNEYVDIRNNVFYNWAGEGCYGGEGMKVNMVNNYYKPGPATDAASAAVKYRIAKIGIRTSSYIATYPAFEPMLHVWGKFFIDGNKIEGNTEVTNDNWTKGVYAQQSNGAGVDNLWTQTTMDTIRLTQPLETGIVTTHTADKAYELVLDYVGCSLNRDDVDTRIIADVRNRKATCTASGNKAGYINTPSDIKPANASVDWTPWLPATPASAPIDSDGDGIPDDWEDAHGLNKNNAADGKLLNAEGYTNLEVYLNSLVAGITGNQNQGGLSSILNPSGKSREEIQCYVEASSKMLIVRAKEKIKQMDVFAVSGQKICSLISGNREDTVSLVGLSAGIYIVRVIYGDNSTVYTTKIRL